ncbi:hypothetical protein BGZ81_009599 [Podila clonocystis]|nr:hypothetical protein BGZ81_009599 [Podila clonocystis]
MSGITTITMHHSTVLGDRIPHISSLVRNKPTQYHQYRQYYPSSFQSVPSIIPKVKTALSVALRLPPVVEKVDSGSPSASSSSSYSRRTKSLAAPKTINAIPISGKTSATAAPKTAFSKSRVATSNMLQRISLEHSAPDPEPKLPFLHYQTKDAREVLYTRDEDEANKWLSDIKTNLLAFDAEWKPYNIVGPGMYEQGKMSLIQLGDDRTVYLFHIFHMEAFPAELSRILRDKRVIKVGINIRADGTKLFKDWGVACASMVELGSLCTQVLDDLNNSRQIRSMDSLVRELLGHAVEKTSLTRMGNWERKELTSRQISYAANDAYVTYEVAERIKSLQKTGPARKQYTIPMATIHPKGGATVLNIRGTLQHVQDHGIRAQDIIDEPLGSGGVRAKGSEASVKKATSTTTTPTAKKSPSVSAWGKKAQVSIKQAKALIKKPVASPPLASPPSPPSSGPPKLVAIKAIQGSYPDYVYKNLTEVRTIRLGRKSTVTIIPPQFQKRLFSRSRHNASKKSEHSATRAVGDVYLPKELLPEPMEGKDVLERNQAVWLEAGGRDLEEDEVAQEASDDWYLMQNQSLYASLSSTSEDVGDIPSEETLEPSNKD